MLATSFHETARTMQPIREYGRGKGMRYGTTYYGRGFVQLTWEANYRKASAVAGVDLVAHPDRALELPIAAAILFDGMIKGWFTGPRLADYISGTLCDFVQARRIINGTDRATLIAEHAVRFGHALARAAAAAPTPSDAPTKPAPPASDRNANPPSAPVPMQATPPPDRPARPPDDPGQATPLSPPASPGGFFHALRLLWRALFGNE